MNNESPIEAPGGILRQSRGRRYQRAAIVCSVCMLQLALRRKVIEALLVIQTNVRTVGSFPLFAIRWTNNILIVNFLSRVCSVLTLRTAGERQQVHEERATGCSAQQP